LVFPSRTDTFGMVLLEALACGLPVAALPVPGPLDVIGASGAGVLDMNLRGACLAALEIPRGKARAHALTFTWAKSARQFLDNILLAKSSAPCRLIASPALSAEPGGVVTSCGNSSPREALPKRQNGCAPRGDFAGRHRARHYCCSSSGLRADRSAAGARFVRLSAPLLVRSSAAMLGVPNEPRSHAVPLQIKLPS
jgi:hypothetical protein